MAENDYMGIPYDMSVTTTKTDLDRVIEVIERRLKNGMQSLATDHFTADNKIHVNGQLHALSKVLEDLHALKDKDHE